MPIGNENLVRIEDVLGEESLSFLIKDGFLDVEFKFNVLALLSSHLGNRHNFYKMRGCFIGIKPVFIRLVVLSDVDVFIFREWVGNL